jgi:uncharacterized protein
MIDFGRIEGFDWDGGNDRKSLEKHEVGAAEAEQAFADPAILVAADAAHSSSEPRFRALGRTLDGRLLFVSFTLRDEGRKIRVISARPANRKERDVYGQEA